MTPDADTDAATTTATTTTSAPAAVRNVRGFTLLDPLPDLPFEASDGTHSTLQGYFRGAWGLLFSHPDDFTPICTTELGELARLDAHGEFAARGVRLLGLSCNSVASHRAWIRDIEAFGGAPVRFPIVADESRRVAAELGMLAQDDLDRAGLPLTVRTLFVLDPEVRIRLTLTYPASTGRNFAELLRVLDSLQLADRRPVATPVNWRRGDAVCVAASLPGDAAAAAFSDMVVETLPSGRDYLRFTADPGAAADDDDDSNDDAAA